MNTLLWDIKFNNGVLIQWISSTLPADNPNNSKITSVNLPTSFSNTNFRTVLSVYEVAGSHWADTGLRAWPYSISIVYVTAHNHFSSFESISVAIICIGS